MSKLLSREQIDEIIFKYNNNKTTCVTLGKEYNVDYGVIIRLLRRNGVEIRTKKFSKEKELEIVNKYISDKESNTCTLAKENDCSRSLIAAILKRYNVKQRENSGCLKRQYPVNETYFDTIDTEHKAYFLGLLYADGAIYKSGAIALALQARDKHILESFNKELQTNRPLLFRDLATKHPKWQNVWRLDLHSKRILENLIKLGCHPKKTYSLHFPDEAQIPKHLIRFFILGYLDGDGSICYKKCNNRKNSYSIRVSFSSCIYFLEGLKKVLLETLGIRLHIGKPRAKVNSLCRDSVISSKYDSIKLLNWLYEDSNIHLFRKYEIYKHIINCEKENLIKRNLLV